jgi:hypothetical protein
MEVWVGTGFAMLFPTYIPVFFILTDFLDLFPIVMGRGNPYANILNWWSWRGGWLVGEVGHGDVSSLHNQLFLIYSVKLNILKKNSTIRPHRPRWAIRCVGH